MEYKTTKSLELTEQCRKLLNKMAMEMPSAYKVDGSVTPLTAASVDESAMVTFLYQGEMFRLILTKL